MRSGAACDSGESPAGPGRPQLSRWHHVIPFFKASCFCSCLAAGPGFVAEAQWATRMGGLEFLG